MRLSDLVRWGHQGQAPARQAPARQAPARQAPARQAPARQAPARQAPELPWRPSDLVQQEREETPVPQVQDDILPRDAPAEGSHASPQEASSRATAVGQGDTQGTPPLKELEGTDQVHRRAFESVEEILRAVRMHTPFTLLRAERTVEGLLESLQDSEALLIHFFGIGGHAPGPALEAVNMCTLALKIGLELDYPPEELRKLGLAALLADIGKACLPEELLAEGGSLSRAERASLRNYPEEGARLVGGVGPQYSWLAEVLLQVHERMDGSGYPKGLKGSEIHEYGQIMGLADVYESLVHERPFRPRLGPLQALKEILRQERKGFSDRILKALIRTLSTFPVGSLVRLNTGEIGRVVAKHQNLPLRPVVEVLLRHGKKPADPLVIDLSKNPLLHIQDSVVEQVLEEEASRDRT